MFLALRRWLIGQPLATAQAAQERLSKVVALAALSSDEEGRPVGVIAPIELWREIEAERETAYLLKNETMKKRLLEAKNRVGGVSLEDVRAELGI